jgi:aldose 1-epimerase
VVALRGVTLLSWSVDGVELIDGYADQTEFDQQVGMRSAMMIPFSNRIVQGRYTFDSHVHDLNDPASSGELVLHGLLREVDFSVTSSSVGESSAVVRFVSLALRPGAFPGYPFAVDVAIDLTVTDAGLEFVVTGTNAGDTAAPFAVGWHPYFTIGSAPIEQLVVSIPGTARIVTDDQLIPLDGQAAVAEASGVWDYRVPRVLGDAVLDTAYADLSSAPDGLVRSTIADPASGRSIDVWQERGLMHVFTSDTVSRPRQSIAMEPVEVMTNAFNRPEQAAAIRLEPGERRRFRFGAATTLETP